MDATAIQEIIAVCRRLDQKGLVNAYEGNVSIRRAGHIYITPTRVNKAFLTEEMVCVFREDTMEQVAGTKGPSSEMLLHTEAYKARLDVFGVVHAHPTMMTAYSLCGKAIKSRAYPEMICAFKTIPCAPYGRPGTTEIFDVARDLVMQHDIVLLGNHGVLVMGCDLMDALNKAEAGEAIAKVLYYAERMGQPIQDLPDAEVEMFLAK